MPARASYKKRLPSGQIQVADSYPLPNGPAHFSSQGDPVFLDDSEADAEIRRRIVDGILPPAKD